LQGATEFQRRGKLMRTRKLPTIILVCLAALAWQVLHAESAWQNPLPSTGQATGRPAQASDETAALRATVDQYCVTCHNSRYHYGDLVRRGADRGLNRIADDLALWESDKSSGPARCRPGGAPNRIGRRMPRSSASSSHA
jgi:hypothetical protein